MQRSMMMAAVAMLLAASTAQAQWGDLKVQLKFGGAPKAASAISVTKDPDFCGKHNLKSEKLVVDPATKGLKNVVVFLYARSSTKVPVHPDYAKDAKATVQIDNKNCRYEPHIVSLMAGQKLKVGNPDPVAHNSKLDFFKNKPENPIIPANKSVEFQIKTEEPLPARVSCSIHPWMEAWVVVKKHPYIGISNEKGEVVIKNVPAGKWTFQFWHETAGYLQSVEVGGKKTSWRRGRTEVKMTPKGVDLGVVTVPASAFMK